MLSLVALLCTPAHAADLVTTELRTRAGTVSPQVMITADPPGVADPPIPDLTIDGNVAISRVRVGRTDGAMRVTVGVGERDNGIAAILYRPDPGTAPVVVWGRGAVERVFPPGPCKYSADLPPGPCSPVDRALPPGPCFELTVVLGDGSQMNLEIAVQGDGVDLDPGSIVGFNPQPEPPGDLGAAISFDVDARSRDGGEVEISLMASDGRAALPVW